jgi:hypothetical protein
MESISWLDISIIAAYLALMVLVGVWFQGSIKSLDKPENATPVLIMKGVTNE